MATTPLRIALLPALLITFLTLPTTASAATTAPNYRLDAVRYANGTAMGTCRGWGADSDDAGNFYMACPVMRDLDGDGRGDVQTPALFELTPTGVVARIGWLPAEYAFNDRYPIRDVGVSPDGNTAYVSVGPNTDNLGLRPDTDRGATMGSILRLTRQADGSWLHDPAFKAGPFRIAGGNYWAIRYVDVDARGRIYVTVNSYVYELSPTTGQIVSAFGGGHTAYPGGPWTEGFDVPEGLAVSADGNQILIVEQQHHLVQRWQRVGATDWKRDTSLLIGVPSVEGDELCQSNAHLQSPYDVSIDAAGDIYVLDTSCQRIQRFTSTGRFVQTVWSNMGGDDLSHGMAVNWQGSVLLPIEEDVLVRLDPPKRPATGGGPPPGGGGTCTNAAAPRITGVTVPARTRTRRVEITAVTAQDCAITHVRVVGTGRSGTGRWIDGTKLIVPLGGWNGRKDLTVQVRDAKGRTAARRIAVTLALPQAPLRARARVALPGRGCNATIAPQRRIGSYRLLDRCARINGRVVSVGRSGRSGSLALQVLVPTPTARALYSNAVGPVRIWVVTDRLTRTTGKRAAVGRAATVDAAVAAERNLGAVHVLAVDRVRLR